MMVSPHRLGSLDGGTVPGNEPKPARPLHPLGAYGSIPLGNAVSASWSLEYLAVSISPSWGSM